MTYLKDKIKQCINKIRKRFNRIYLKIRVWLIQILLFTLTIMLMKGNNIGDIYVRDPLKILGFVISIITALITMLIFIINFNVNDMYLGRSKSKTYLEDRVLIQFIKTKLFRFIFFVFLLITIKVCGIAFKGTYIYIILKPIKLFSNILYFLEKHYIDIGVFSFLILTFNILFSIIGNIKQLFLTIRFKEEDMFYLKLKIEESITKNYQELLSNKEKSTYFWNLLEDDYYKIKENEKEQFLELVFGITSNKNIFSDNNYSIFEMTLEEFEKFLHNKYNWIKKM